MRKKLLAITPIEHIDGLYDKLQAHFELIVYPDPIFSDVAKILPKIDVIYTNPNKSRLPVNAKIIEAAKNLKVIVTASTGLVHVDLESAKSKGVKVISLTQEYETINRISSTAEHALALTLLSVRNLFWAITDVQRKQWDYEKFVGRQINALTVGVMGYGRLGKMYAR